MFDALGDRIQALESSKRFTAPYGGTNPAYPSNGDLWVRSDLSRVYAQIAGSAVQVYPSSGGVTSAVAGTGISVSSATGAVTFTNTGVTSATAGTGISVSASTGGVTFSNTGVTGLTGTSNQVTVSASTGSVTVSLPSSITISGKYISTGNAQVSLGAWSASDRWSGAEGSNGYLLLNNADGNTSIFLRTSGGGNVYIGGNGNNVITVGSNDISLTGSISAVGNIDIQNRYRGTAGSSSGGYVQMRSGNAASWSWDGTYRMYVDSSNVKNFTIQHPNKTDNWLVHACAEGATSDVFYRGEGQLKSGICVVTLPDYFEALTETEGRSVMLTPIADEHGMVANLAAYEIEDGQFLVEQIGGYHVPDQRFWWRVDAVRKNTTFNVEPKKSSVTVHGMGPYTYIESNS
jgi:hypothetical protein